MSSILLRIESSSSSQIENLTVGARQLADLEEAKSANAQTVHRNAKAMEAAFSLSDRVSIDSILLTHRELMRGEPYLGDHAGSRTARVGGQQS